MGVGRAVARSGNVYTVFNYSPPGNFHGGFRTETGHRTNLESARKDQESVKENKEAYLEETESLVTFQTKFFKLHNEYREKYKAPPVVLNKKVIDVHILR